MKTLKVAPIKNVVNLLLAVITLSAMAFTLPANWKVKQPYAVNFAGGKINGKFESLKADISFDKAHPENAKILASIDVASIATGIFIKNNHAKDALDADKYPTISFASTKVNKNDSAFDAIGNLTMKGITKPITIHFTFDDKGSEGIFKGGFKVRTRDFNITRKGSPDELEIMLVVPVTKA